MDLFQLVLFRHFCAISERNETHEINTPVGHREGRGFQRVVHLTVIQQINIPSNLQVVQYAFQCCRHIDKQLPVNHRFRVLFDLHGLKITSGNRGIHFDRRERSEVNIPL